MHKCRVRKGAELRDPCNIKDVIIAFSKGRKELHLGVWDRGSRGRREKKRI